MTAQTTPAIPEMWAQRFANAFAAFLDEVRAAVDEGKLNPVYSSTPAFLMWQTEALPRLEQELAAIQNAFALFQIGETGTIAQLASAQRGLAKHLDGFPLDFAGPEHAKTLDKLETAVVVAAYQLCKAAGIP
jgi:uncharacterized protein CbrC (UPF0167 family)